MFRLRETPEDFRVEEIPLYPPLGDGGHTFVCIEKRLRTTEEVARDLARAAGVHPRDVGYAGRKDRRAVAVQWLSVPALDPEAALALRLPGVVVREAVRHPHKLRTGQLRGNRFEITVRGVDAAAWEQARPRLDALMAHGLPNRFGEQRFGREGDNALRGAALLRGEPVRGARREARFLVSALQSAVFNDVLEARPEPWRLEPGDLAMRHVSGGAFLVEDVSACQPRADAFEISPTGPIFGTRMSWPSGAVLERERAVLARWQLDPEALRPPRGIRLRGGRRPLRVPLAEMAAERVEDALQLRFALPAGSYATVLVEALLGPQREPPAAAE